MFLSTTFTDDNSAAAGHTYSMNIYSWKSGILCNFAAFALMYAAVCEWDARAEDDSPNIAGTFPFPRQPMKELIQNGVNVWTAAGVITKFRVSPSQTQTVGGDAGVEGFVLDIRVGTTGTDATAAHYSLFVPFHLITTFPFDTNATGFEVGCILAAT